MKTLTLVQTKFNSNQDFNISVDNVKHKHVFHKNPLVFPSKFMHHSTYKKKTCSILFNFVLTKIPKVLFYFILKKAEEERYQMFGSIDYN